MKVLFVSIVFLLFLSCNHSFKQSENEKNEFNDVKGSHLIYPNTEIVPTLKLVESFIYEYATSYHWIFTWWFETETLSSEQKQTVNQKYSYKIEKDWNCADTKSYVYIFDEIKIKNIEPIVGEFAGYYLDRTRESSEIFKVPKSKALLVKYDLHVIADGSDLERGEKSDLDKTVPAYLTIYKKDNGQWGVLFPSCKKYYTKQGFINFLYLVSKNETKEKKDNRYTLKVIKKLKEKWIL